MNSVTLEQVKQARARIAEWVRRTPTEYSRWLTKELSREIFLKLECFQQTGSFKLRGAMAKLTALSDEEKARGVLTVSAGNHGLAVARGAEVLKIDATIVVPKSASRAKVEAIRRFPVTLIERGANYDEAERAAREMERESGKTFVSPYNDLEVIAGQGTIALEILEDAPHLDAMVIPVGGGGLIAGIALAAKALNPQIKIYGAEPATTPTMMEALKAGQIIEVIEDDTIADGLAGNIEPGSITFPIVQRFVDDMITVSEAEIGEALYRFAREEHVMIEGSAAVSLAALHSPKLTGQSLAAIISGRNISLDVFMRAIASKL
ncbi:MAG: threonine/serine dehydratase [Acidobacteriota bacterium]